MAFNYTQLATKAKQLIERFGRAVSIVKFDESPADADKPWRGDLTPRTSPEATQAVYGVFVEPSAVEQLGFSTTKPEFFDRSTQILLVTPGPTLAANLEEYDEVVDGTVRWKITGVEVLKPGTMRLLYFIGVAR